MNSSKEYRDLCRSREMFVQLSNWSARFGTEAKAFFLRIFDHAAQRAHERTALAHIAVYATTLNRSPRDVSNDNITGLSEKPVVLSAINDPLSETKIHAAREVVAAAYLAAKTTSLSVDDIRRAVWKKAQNDPELMFSLFRLGAISSTAITIIQDDK